jgi:hypothetical protein
MGLIAGSGVPANTPAALSSFRSGLDGCLPWPEKLSDRPVRKAGRPPGTEPFELARISRVEEAADVQVTDLVRLGDEERRLNDGAWAADILAVPVAGGVPTCPDRLPGEVVCVVGMWARTGLSSTAI